ncbi:MAG: GspH/FimT family pseudopilin [Gammaproteobacteria bacterium]|nr:GspH/FimT family pseudopilin [Gammaproteobacteria bacterium]
MTNALQSGFSLIELLVVLAIAGIFVTMAAPSFNEMVQNGKIDDSHNSLVAALIYTRSEAITRRQPMTLCRSSDSTSCGGNWEDGWIAFVDIDGDASVDAGDGDQVVRLRQALNNGVTIRGNGNNSNRVTYAAQGNTTNNGTFRVCDARGATEASGLVIAMTGRVRRAIDSDDNGVVEDGSGDITCP